MLTEYPPTMELVLKFGSLTNKMLKMDEMIDITEIISMRISYEIDKDMIIQMWKLSAVEESKINEYVINMDMRFEDKVYRFERSLTNKDIHC